MKTIVTELDQATSTFLGTRRRLFGIAYQTLGSVTEAEDIVQEAWLRWQRTDRKIVLNPTAFLATTTSRLALNSAMSARRKHETCVDAPATGSVDRQIGPEASVERREAVGQAVGLLLQKLTPLERAAYVLREAFDYPHQRIAEIMHITPAYSRQLALRAQRGITAKPPRPIDPAEQRHLEQVFLTASRTGNLRALEQLLAADADGRV